MNNDQLKSQDIDIALLSIIVEKESIKEKRSTKGKEAIKEVAERLKRQSNNNSTTSQPLLAKRAKAINMLANKRLDFNLTNNLASYISRLLIVLLIFADKLFDLFIIIYFRLDNAYYIPVIINNRENNKDFQATLRIKIYRILIILVDYYFRNINIKEQQILYLESELLLELLEYEERLRYDIKDKGKIAK